MTIPLDRRMETASAPLFAPLGLALPLGVEQTGREAFDADPALASFVLRSARAVLEAADARSPPRSIARALRPTGRWR